MPIMICKGCGRKTNSTMCNWSHNKDYEPTLCYAYWDESDQCYKKGCGYDKASEFDKYFADKHITNSE